MRVRSAVAAMLLLCAAPAAVAQEQPVSVFSGRLRPSLGYCQLTSIAASTQLSACAGGIPSGAGVADIIVEAQAIRYRTDGSAPTTTVGMPLAVGTEKIFALTDLSQIRVIAQTAGAIVNIEFFAP